MMSEKFDGMSKARFDAQAQAFNPYDGFAHCGYDEDCWHVDVWVSGFDGAVADGALFRIIQSDLDRDWTNSAFYSEGRAGECPRCECDDLEYDEEPTYNGDYIEYAGTCPECGLRIIERSLAAEVEAQGYDEEAELFIEAVADRPADAKRAVLVKDGDEWLIGAITTNEENEIPMDCARKAYEEAGYETALVSVADLE